MKCNIAKFVMIFSFDSFGKRLVKRVCCTCSFNSISKRLVKIVCSYFSFNYLIWLEDCRKS